MHPIDHARSSAAAFGGIVSRHLEFHAFLDSTKMAVALAQHRMFLHTTDLGLEIAREVFGDHVNGGGGVRIPVAAMLERHLEEDLGKLATLADWLHNAEPEEYGADDEDDALAPHILAFRRDPLGTAARTWGGETEDYKQVLGLLTAGGRLCGHPLADQPMRSSVGPFIAERCFGALTHLSNGGTVRTRVVAERFIAGFRGCIEPGSKLAEAIPLEDWMTRPRSDEAGRK